MPVLLGSRTAGVSWLTLAAGGVEGGSHYPGERDEHAKTSRREFLSVRCPVFGAAWFAATTRHREASHLRNRPDGGTRLCLLHAAQAIDVDAIAARSFPDSTSGGARSALRPLHRPRLTPSAQPPGDYPRPLRPAASRRRSCPVRRFRAVAAPQYCSDRDRADALLQSRAHAYHHRFSRHPEHGATPTRWMEAGRVDALCAIRRRSGITTPSRDTPLSRNFKFMAQSHRTPP